MAFGGQFDSAQIGSAFEDHPFAYCVPGERETVTERESDRALLEIYPRMMPADDTMPRSVMTLAEVA